MQFDLCQWRQEAKHQGHLQIFAMSNDRKRCDDFLIFVTTCKLEDDGHKNEHILRCEMLLSCISQKNDKAWLHFLCGAGGI